LLLEQLQVACLQGQPKTLDHRSKETTLVHGIFGGHLRQQIVCQKCRNPSNTYEALLALSVDVCNTIDQSLARITSSEMLVGKNRYRCAHCKSLQDARKQTTLYRAPQTLIVHLKRFHFAARSSKISKHVQIPERLDVSKYMAPGRTALPYTLTGVVVHDGGGVSSGHYYAFGKQSNGVWAEYNDSSVSQVSLGRVLKQQAYMLFYTQDEGETLKGASNKSTSSEIPLKQSTTSPVSQMVPLKKRKAEELTVTNGSSDVLAMLDRDASSHKPRTHLRNGVGAVSREAREHGSGSWSKKRSHEQRHTGHNKKRIITSMRRV
jgi:ubiquitin carboxyl-terminal hydrolase 36/42